MTENNDLRDFINNINEDNFADAKEILRTALKSRFDEHIEDINEPDKGEE